MKLKLFDRILLVILLIAAIAVSVVLFGVSTRVITKPVALDFVSLFYLNAHNALILASAGLVVLLIAVRLLVAGKKRPLPQTVTALVRQGEVGSTFITLSAIDTMANKYCSGIDHVQQCFTSVRAVDGGVSIGVRLDVDENAEVVPLCEGLQTSMKEYIESHTGIVVREIGVLVENLNAAAEPAALATTN